MQWDRLYLFWGSLETWFEGKCRYYSRKLASEPDPQQSYRWIQIWSHNTLAPLLALESSVVLAFESWSQLQRQAEGPLWPQLSNHCLYLSNFQNFSTERLHLCKTPWSADWSGFYQFNKALLVKILVTLNPLLNPEQYQELTVGDRIMKRRFPVQKIERVTSPNRSSILGTNWREKWYLFPVSRRATPSAGATRAREVCLWEKVSFPGS